MNANCKYKDLLVRIVEANQWLAPTDGGYCHWCGQWQRGVGDPEDLVGGMPSADGDLHKPDCPWLELEKLLGVEPTASTDFGIKQLSSSLRRCRHMMKDPFGDEDD